MTFTFAKAQIGSSGSPSPKLVNRLELDKYDPGYPKLPKRSRKKLGPEHRVYFNAYTHGRRSIVGVRPDKMRDWRALERRRSELFDLWTAVNEEFWDAMRQTTQGADDRVSRVICVGKSYTIHFHPNESFANESSYSVVDAEQTVSDTISKSTRKYVLISETAGGRRIGSLYERQNRLYKAYLKYDRAFKRAVGDRIEAYVRNEKGFHLSRTESFIIQSESRLYLLTQTKHGVAWSEGPIHVIT